MCVYMCVHARMHACMHVCVCVCAWLTINKWAITVIYVTAVQLVTLRATMDMENSAFKTLNTAKLEQPNTSLKAKVCLGLDKIQALKRSVPIKDYDYDCKCK